MSYQSISVKEAVNNLNANVNGWFLPAVQRPYVWGSRYESEVYICKLFDSIVKGYPIGGLIIWNTDESIPYREFMHDFKEGDFAKIVEKGLFSKPDKWLVYDGQQRLQTLFSCLKYSFNNRILVYNLLFDDENIDDPNETGFYFVEKNTDIENYSIKMNELFSRSISNESEFENSLFLKNHKISNEKKELLKKNSRKLWKVFVETDKKSIAFFPIKETTESEVNEIFQRLNSSGIPLSQSDLLLSRIKEKYFDFEENLQAYTNKIYNNTGKGFIFKSDDILKLIYLLVKGTIRVDPKRVKDSEIDEFQNVWNKLKKPLIDFFTYFIWQQFKINHTRLVPLVPAFYPILIYFYNFYNIGLDFKKIQPKNLKNIKRFFIKSQINDWALQSFIDNFTRIINDNFDKENFEFPSKKIINFIKESKKRLTKIEEENFINFRWFALKILLPKRSYEFDPDQTGRFTPQIDHIFPLSLKKDDEYRNNVDIIWNMQPSSAEINLYKWHYNPKDFFTNSIKNKKGESIIGSKYLNEYDFLYPIDSKNRVDFNNSVWLNPSKFIEGRKNKMKDFLYTEYGIKLLRTDEDVDEF